MEPQIIFDKDDIEKNKWMAVIAYLGILFLVPLLAAPDSGYAKYHANQGLVLFLAGLVSGAVGLVPFLGWILAPIVGVALFIFMIMGMVNAYQGQAKPLPLIGTIEIIK